MTATWPVAADGHAARNPEETAVVTTPCPASSSPPSRARPGTGPGPSADPAESNPSCHEPAAHHGTGSAQVAQGDGRGTPSTPEPRRLRTLRGRVVTWIVMWELAAIAVGTLGMLMQPFPTTEQWVTAALLVAANAVHMLATQRVEERRRASDVTGERAPTSVDHSALWSFTAALILPLSLALVVLLHRRVYRYRMAYKAPAQFLYTTAAIAFSVYGAHGIALLAGHRADEHGHLSGEQYTLALALLAAIVWYWAAQTVLVGAVKTLDTGWSGARDAFGPVSENLSLLVVLCGGAVAALAVSFFATPAVALLTPVAITATLVEQRFLRESAKSRQLEHDATTDTLTGLPNRRGFDPRAELALLRSANTHRPAAVVMADLDHFKHWNTTLGHLGADQLLIAVAAVVRRETRDHDLLCRWGGEEVAILMPDTGRADAFRLAERLRRAVAAVRAEVTKPAGGGTQHVTGCTVSLGVATAPDDGSHLTPLQEHADAALQIAKDNGRNLVVLSNTRPARHPADPPTPMEHATGDTTRADATDPLL